MFVCENPFVKRFFGEPEAVLIWFWTKNPFLHMYFQLCGPECKGCKFPDIAESLREQRFFLLNWTVWCTIFVSTFGRSTTRSLRLFRLPKSQKTKYLTFFLIHSHLLLTVFNSLFGWMSKNLTLPGPGLLGEREIDWQASKLKGLLTQRCPGALW